MKKLALTLASAFVLFSCASNSTTTNTAATSNDTLSTITKVAQITSTISELSNLFGGLNLTDSQSSLVKNALVSYVKDYSGLNTNASNYSSLLSGLKTETLDEIKTGLGTNKYNEVFTTLKAFSANKKVETVNTNSTANELVTQALISLIK